MKIVAHYTVLTRKRTPSQYKHKKMGDHDFELDNSVSRSIDYGCIFQGFKEETQWWSEWNESLGFR